jgi:hypothetical protein
MGEMKFVVVAVFIVDIPIDNSALRRGEQHNVGFDSPCWEENHSGSEAAVVSDTASYDRAVRQTELATAVQSSQWSRQQVEIRKG